MTADSKHPIWNPTLYEVQLNSPTAKAVNRRKVISNAPSYYGYEYHGEIGIGVAETLLQREKDGSYLVRCYQGTKKTYLLAVKFDNKVVHYRIEYIKGVGHHLKENTKYFDRVHDLVADFLVFFNMQKFAPATLDMTNTATISNFDRTPYMTLNHRKLKALSTEIRKSLNLESFPKENLDKIDYTNSLLPSTYEKPHEFKVHTFKGLYWCEFCSNFLWGFKSQGVKCKDCGSIAHIKCSERIPRQCVPSLKKIRGIFGIDLTTLCMAHKYSIPFILTRCVKEIEARGLVQEGIYRVSGFSEDIDNLKMEFDKDAEKTDISAKAYPNINVIAGVLKLYLRLLPIPIITFQAYKSFMESDSDKISTLRKAVKQLPQTHYDCLKFLLNHLNKIAQHSAVNKMNEQNLAIVFAPTLIASPENFTDYSHEISNLKLLMKHFKIVFFNS
ncbi:CHN1 family protein [Megaselia abdita]